MELRDITKTFPGVIANKDINLAVRRGTVHAIVGENGAGKSTLMKTLYGMHRPDSGTVSIDGEQVELTSPSDAIDRGVGMVHQHFQLADNLTVLENVVLGSEPRKGVRLDFAEAYLVACAESTGTGRVVSFDRAIDRVNTVERIEP